MSTNLHEYFLEARKIQKARKGIFLSRRSRVSRLKITQPSAFSIHNSPTGALLKEIQR